MDTATMTFRCPTCEEELSVNASMRDALLEHGCVICTSAVSVEDFEAGA